MAETFANRYIAHYSKQVFFNIQNKIKQQLPLQLCYST